MIGMYQLKWKVNSDLKKNKQTTFPSDPVKVPVLTSESSTYHKNEQIFKEHMGASITQDLIWSNDREWDELYIFIVMVNTVQSTGESFSTSLTYVLKIKGT